MASTTTPDFDEVQSQFDELLVAKKYAKAEAVLQRAAESALDRGDPFLAAHWTTLRGALYSIQQRDAECLAAYEEAEKLQPGNGTRCLTTASHLIYAVGDPARALDKIERALELLSRSPEHLYAIPDALGLQAVAWLRLGREEEALERFESFCGAAEGGPHTPVMDLRLAEELIASDLRLADCAKYLEDILGWADRTRNRDLARRAERLLAKLEDSKS